jgi:exopolyphosphatase/guanosine-5'-triphosphate,3'-diphosphate pyrophosphatase
MSNENLPTAQSDPGVLAAFDIGSNSIKMTLARRAGNGIDEFAWKTETVRLGQGVDATGSLAPDRIEAGLTALRSFSDFARQQGASRLIGVATEATRIASNGQAFLERVTAETGIELALITGGREAELTFLGLDGVVDLTGDVLVADIGGGSTEIILAVDRHVRFSQSFPVGSGRLTEQFVRTDPPTMAELAACRTSANNVLRAAPFEEAPRARLFITGGTGDYSFRMIPAGTLVDASVIDGLLREMTAVPAKKLAKRLAIPIARAAVLPAGVAVVRGLIELARPSEIQAAQSGIRRGLLLAAFAGTI